MRAGVHFSGENKCRVLAESIEPRKIHVRVKRQEHALGAIFYDVLASQQLHATNVDTFMRAVIIDIGDTELFQLGNQ